MGELSSCYTVNFKNAEHYFTTSRGMKQGRNTSNCTPQRVCTVKALQKLTNIVPHLEKKNAYTYTVKLLTIICL